MRTTDKNGLKMFWKSATSQKLTPSDKGKVMVILYISQLKERPNQPCFSMTEEGSVWKAWMCLWAFTDFIERGEREKDQKEMEADVWRDAELTPSTPLIYLTQNPSNPAHPEWTLPSLSFSFPPSLLFVSSRGPSNCPHCSSSPKTSFCLRFMFSKSKSVPVMRL